MASKPRDKPNKLPEALSNAMEPADFEALIFSGLNKKLFEIISYPDFALAVSKAAARSGWTGELVDAALKNSTRNTLLREFAFLDPINEAISNPSNKSTAMGGEVHRGLHALINLLTDSNSDSPYQLDLTELNSNLAYLYKEYDELFASTVSA